MARRSDAFVAVGAAASAARVIRKDVSARVIARVGSTALRKGMHSGNRAWFYVAAGATGLRLLPQVRRAARKTSSRSSSGRASRSRSARSDAGSSPVAFTR